MTTATLSPPPEPAPQVAADAAPELSSEAPSLPKQIVVEAEEIVFRAGDATITLSREQGGIVEIHAPTLRLTGDNILSEATESNTTVGRRIVSEAISVSELLGRLVRVDGQCVRIT